ncbi:uncharacterized [Tachysurus ichikawai]
MEREVKCQRQMSLADLQSRDECGKRHVEGVQTHLSCVKEELDSLSIPFIPVSASHNSQPRPSMAKKRYSEHCVRNWLINTFILIKNRKHPRILYPRTFC